MNERAEKRAGDNLRSSLVKRPRLHGSSSSANLDEFYENLRIQAFAAHEKLMINAFREDEIHVARLRADLNGPLPDHIPPGVYRNDCYIPPLKSIEERMDYMMAQNREFAEVALEHFNKQYGTHYVLVQALGCSCRPTKFITFLYHLNFTAKQGADVHGSSTKLFFTELHKQMRKPEVRCCDILDVEGSRFAHGCQICDSYVVHPAGFYIPPGVDGPNGWLEPLHKDDSYMDEINKMFDREVAESREIAEAALNYFNKRHGTKYVLLHAMGYSCKPMTSIYHMNFTAKQEGDVQGSSMKIFLANFNQTRILEVRCGDFHDVEGSRFADGCLFCPSYVIGGSGFGCKFCCNKAPPSLPSVELKLRRLPVAKYK